MGDVGAVLKQIDAGIEASLQRLFCLIRFPTIATDPNYDADCHSAAAWLRREFEGLGFVINIHKTTGQPVTIGNYKPESPSHVLHVLFYGHYDVQPADRVELWTTPPFEPHIRKGKNGQDQIFARGSSDNKGQLMTFVEACRGWLAVHDKLPFQLTILIEGDEEGERAHLDRFLAENRKALKPDVAFVCDTDIWDPKTPAINTFLRGCIAKEVTITGPRIDLHSGYYGGAVVNPIKVLSRVLAAMHNRNGKITIPGFYDGVKPLTAESLKEWVKLKFPTRQFLGDVGLGIPASEKGYTALEQIWARPTAEVNGILGGYTGAGTKTVLPAQAMAKSTFRLVNGQNPSRMRAAFRKFVKAQLPKDRKARFISHGRESSGVDVSRDSRYVLAARKVLKAEWGRSPVMSGSGGSVPVVESFKKHLKIDNLMIGFARQDDNAHSPNEKYDVESFHKGIRSWARIISELDT